MNDHLLKTETRHQSAGYVFKKDLCPRAEARGNGWLQGHQ